MTSKMKKLLQIKDVIDYKPNADESEEYETATGKHLQDASYDLVNFIQRTLNQYNRFQQLSKEIESLDQKQKMSSLKLKEALKCVAQTKRAASNLEKKKALRTKIHDLYKYNLGLEIKPLKGGLNEEQTEIMFSFHYINKNKPEEEYSFILQLNGQKYDVKSCNPPIKGIGELLSELNRTNDLSAFVIQVKMNFCTAATT